MVIAANEWPDEISTNHFKIFAERCLELVDPRSHDNYRVRALSTPLKIRELQYQCGQVINGRVPKKTIGPLIDEVNEAVRSDPVIQAIFTEKNLPISIIEVGPNETTEEIRSRAQLAARLASDDYRKQCERLIIAECHEGGSKNKLQLLAKLYLTELMNLGFHREFLLRRTRERFFLEKIEACEPELLQSYFDLFKLDEERKFSILLVGSANYINFLKGTFGFRVYKEASDLPEELRGTLPATFRVGKSKMVALIEYGGADPFSAVRLIESFLAIPRSFNLVYPSYLREVLDDECIVYSENGEATKVSRRAVSSPVPSKLSQLKQGSRSVKSLAKYTLASISSGDNSALTTIMKSLNAASLAANSSDSETQLITLWSAFEALLPQPSRDDGGPVRTTHFATLIVPCVIQGYLRSKYRTFFARCSSDASQDFQNVVKDHGKGDQNDERLASIMVGEAEHQERMIKSLLSSPLLMNRAHYLQSILLDPKLAVRKIEGHEKRVEWQVHRIYRERNDIMHAGSRSPFLSVLAENAFLYFRLVIRSLEGTYSEHQVLRPHAALQLVAGAHKAQLADLQQCIRNPQISIEEERAKLFRYIFRD